MSSLRDWIVDNLDFALTIAIGILIFLLTSLNAIPTSEIEKTTLFVLITLTFFVASRNYRLGNKVDSLDASVQSIEQHIKHFTATRIVSGTDEFFHLLNSIVKEDSKLDVTYFSPLPPTQLPGTQCESYLHMLANYLKHHTEFRVRRIVTIETLEKLAWVKSTIAECENAKQYYVGFLGTQQPFPLMNFVIVDSRYVLMFGPHMPETDSHYIFVDNPKIATVASEYFEELWRDSRKIKSGLQVDHAKLSEIEQQLSNESAIHVEPING